MRIRVVERGMGVVRVGLWFCGMSLSFGLLLFCSSLFCSSLSRVVVVVVVVVALLLLW